MPMLVGRACDGCRRLESGRLEPKSLSPQAFILDTSSVPQRQAANAFLGRAGDTSLDAAQQGPRLHGFLLQSQVTAWRE